MSPLPSWWTLTSLSPSETSKIDIRKLQKLPTAKAGAGFQPYFTKNVEMSMQKVGAG